MTVQSMTHLAVLYERQDAKDVRVEPLLLRALKAVEETKGKDNSDVAHPLEMLGRHYFNVHEFEKAELVERRALKINETKWGINSRMLHSDLYDLTQLMRKLAKPEEADAFLARMEHLDTTK